MRARGRWLRRARSQPEPDLRGWVLPHWLDRELDPAATSAAVPAWTSIGNLDSPLEATVDPRGLVTLPQGWSLDWWVGADDRWHLPSREVAVRQRLVEDTPVVETAMRVPGGDVVHRAYAVRDGSTELVVVEIENRSPVPVALAVSVRPFTAGAASQVRRIELAGETDVVVDGRTALILAKPPSRAATSVASAGDVATVVLAGDAPETVTPVSCDERMASAAFVLPLAHRTLLRFAMPLDGRSLAARPVPASLPSSDQVANGWRVQGARGLRVVLPDERLQSAIDANRRFLLLQHDAGGLAVDTLATLALALDRQGFPTEAAALLARITDAASSALVLGALVEHWRLGRDESFARELVVPVAHGAEQLARRGGSRRALLDASELLLAAGEADAAADAARLASRLVSHVGDEPADEGWRAGDELAVSLDRASPTWAWSTPDAGHDHLATAAFLERARGQLVREVEDGVALCSHVPDTWLGRGIEVHDAPTRLGRISFAIRWHGDRPALLWELDAHPGVGETSVRVPGLDPTWSSGERRGDALLAPVAAPGTPVRLKRR